MANEITVEDIQREILETLTVNGITPSEEVAQLRFFKVWGIGAYKQITNNEPCVPATDIVVHAHGEQFPMHRSIFFQIFGNSVKWPTMDGYNVDCFIPAHHFRALHHFAYTGCIYGFLTHMFQELFDHLQVERSDDGPKMGLDTEGIMSETLYTRLSVARHILEFVMILEASGCGNLPSYLADEAFNFATGLWVLFRGRGDITDDIVYGLEKDIELDLQGWHDEISLPYQLKSLELDVSYHARL